jgi:Tfp pilus assembly protein PilZ
MIEKRAHRRTRVRQHVWCEAEELTVYARALDVSVGGLFVRTPSPVGVGQRLRLTLDDSGCQVVAHVEVVWRRAPAGAGAGEPGMGVRILDFEQGAECYRRFVERHLRGGSSPGMVLGLESSGATHDPSNGARDN